MFSFAFIKSTPSIESLTEKMQGYQASRLEDLKRESLSAALLKSYLVETRYRADELEDAFRHSDEFKFYQTSPNFFQVFYDAPRFEESEGAFLEILSERVSVLYTKDKAGASDSRTEKLLGTSTGFESLHITGPSFMGIWNEISPRIPGYRFVEIGCRKDQVVSLLAGDDLDLLADSHESTSSNLVLRDTVNDIQESLAKLQDAYAAFRSIKHIRLPSRSGGGHTVFNNGKVTNRSRSFSEHREILIFFAAFYTNVILSTEALLRDAHAVPSTGQTTGKPVPLVYRFPRPLPIEFVDRLVQAMFSKNGEVKQYFQIRGKPMQLTRGRYQVYGVDGREFAPLNLEITRDHILALVERTVAGSVIQRLIINLQLYVMPASEIWMGSVNLLKLAEDSARKANFDHFDGATVD